MTNRIKEIAVTGGETIQNKIASIGSDIATLRLLSDGVYEVEQDFEMPSNLFSIKEYGTVTTINNATLTINGPFACGPWKCFNCIGTGKVMFGPNSVKMIDPRWWGAKLDGITDDSAAITAAMASMSGPMVYLEGTAKANIVMPDNHLLASTTGIHLICNNFNLIGTIDYTNHYYGTQTGTMRIFPPAGSTYGMYWYNTRYCSFDRIGIGSLSGGPYSDGDGLKIRGSVGLGTYYNNINFLEIAYMNGWGINAQTDDEETSYRISAIGINYNNIQYCKLGGHNLVGIGPIKINAVIEQCEGTILHIGYTTGGAYSYSIKYPYLYTENPSKSNWVVVDQDAGFHNARGSSFELANDYDGNSIPDGFNSSFVNIDWHQRENRIYKGGLNASSFLLSGNAALGFDSGIITLGGGIAHTGLKLGGAATTKWELGSLPPIYANNGAAVDGGLTSGMIYRNGDDPDIMCIVH